VFQWMQLGTLYPFSRNHNTIGARSQEPYAFGPTLLNASIISLNLRYTLLPYYYTNFYEIHISGGSLWRPLFFEFPNDVNAYAIDRQFMVGSALLVTPVLDQGATSVSAYLPASYWYNYHTGASVGDPKQSKKLTLDSPLTSPINIHIRGGYIVPSQRGALTTKASRVTPFTIIVALDGSGRAEGNLFLDDGESLTTLSDNKFSVVKYTVANGTLSSQVTSNGYSEAQALTVERVIVYGIQGSVSNVKVNGQSTTQFAFDNNLKKLTINGFSGISIAKTSTVQWA